MKILNEIHRIMKDLPKVHSHNFVAKHAVKGGAGAHVPKKGPLAPRARQKRQWKKEVHEKLSEE